MGTRAVVALAALAVLPLGAAVGTVGSFLQAATVAVGPAELPVGIVVALGLTAALVVGAGAATRSRLVAAVALVGWLVGVVVMASPRPEGDLVLPARGLAYVWLFGGTLLGGLALALPYDLLGRSPGRIERDGRRGRDPRD